MLRSDQPLEEQQLKQSIEDNIKIYVRIRPFISRELGDNNTTGYSTSCVQCHGSNAVLLMPPGANTSSFDPFVYDFVGDANTTQSDLFQSVGRVVCDTVLLGYNATLFAYGQTSSGKSYTMQGPCDAQGKVMYQERGIIPRTLEYLFAQMSRASRTDNVTFLCKCAYVEIYNETIYDLLDPESPACNLREDLKRGVYIEGNVEESIVSPEDALALLEKGAQYRHVAATAMNRESSRSHSVFTLYIQSKTNQGPVANLKESRFHLVDLAGSERQQLTGTTGIRLKEAGSINRSLMALGHVINALVDVAHGKQRHVHYRDSKLTFLLRDSLGGNAKTFVIANVSPAASCFAETLSTLRFAQRVKLIRNKAVVNKDVQGSVEQLQLEIKRLTDALSVKEQMAEAVDDSSNGNTNSDSLFIQALQRQRDAERQCLSMQHRLQLLEDHCRKWQHQAQSKSMIIKFRDDTISALKRNHPETMADEEKQFLEAEIQTLRDQLAHHPEVTRFAYENLLLRERLQKYDTVQWKQWDVWQKEQQSYVAQLTDRLLAVEQKLKQENNEESKMVDEEREDVIQLNQLNESLQTQIKELELKLEQQIIETNEQLNAAQKKELHLLSSKAELERLVESVKLQRDLEVRKLQDSITGLVKQQQQQSPLEQVPLPNEMVYLKSENTQLRHQLQTMQQEKEAWLQEKQNYETRTRRLSNISSENQTSFKEQLTVLSSKHDQLLQEQFLLDKQLQESRETNSQLQRDYQHVQQQYAELTHQHSLQSNQFKELENEWLECSNQLLHQQREYDQLLTRYQAMQVEHCVLVDEHDYLKSQLETNLAHSSEERSAEWEKVVTENQSLQTQLYSLQSACQKWQKQILLLEQDKADYILQEQEKEVLISQLEEAKENESRSTMEWKNKYLALEQELALLKNQLEETKESLQMLQETKDEEMTKLRHDWMESERALEQLKSSYAASQQNENLLQSQLKLQDTDRSEMIEKLSQQRLLIDKLQTSHDQMQPLLADYESQRVQFKYLQDQYDALKESYSILEQSHDATRQELNTVRDLLSCAERESLLRQEQSLNQTRKWEREQRDFSQREREWLECKQQLEMKLQTLEERSHLQQEENDELLEQLERVGVTGDERQFYEQQISHLQKDLNTANDTSEQLKRELDRLIQHHNTKQKIQYHVKIKQENNALKSEVALLREGLVTVQKWILEATGEGEWAQKVTRHVDQIWTQLQQAEKGTVMSANGPILRSSKAS